MAKSRCGPVVFLSVLWLSGCGGGMAGKPGQGGSAGNDGVGGEGGNGGGSVRDSAIDQAPRDASAKADAAQDARRDQTTPDGSSDPGLPNCVRTRPVASAAEMMAALGDAAPGDCIIAANGDYAVPVLTATGTAEAPVVLRAANRGQATLTAPSVRMTATHLVLDGFASTGLLRLTDCNYCRVTRSRFAGSGAGDVLVVIGTKSTYNRIDHCEIGPKITAGRMLIVTGTNPVQSKYTRIDQNYFHDAAAAGDEVMTLGCCGTWADYQDTFTIVENNLIQNGDGDAEIISIKGSNTVVRYNTLRTSSGTLTTRSGNKNSIYGNFIIGGGKAGSGGIRVYEDDHLIYNNYVEGVAGSALILGSGEADVTKGHAQVKRARIVHNTFLGTLHFGHGGRPLGDLDTVFANNIISASGTLVRAEVASLNPTYRGNIYFGGTLGLMASGFTEADPSLIKVGDVFTLSETSAVIDKAEGSDPEVMDDIHGQTRLKPDVGADEWSREPERRHPLTPADVGPDSPYGWP